MNNLADLITFTTTGDVDIMNELAEARREYWRQRQGQSSSSGQSAHRPCDADRRLRQFCCQYIRSNRRVPSQDVVLRQCLRLNLAPARQLRELRRGRYMM